MAFAVGADTPRAKCAAKSIKTDRESLRPESEVTADNRLRTGEADAKRKFQVRHACLKSTQFGYGQGHGATRDTTDTTDRGTDRRAR